MTLCSLAVSVKTELSQIYSAIALASCGNNKEEEQESTNNDQQDETVTDDYKLKVVCPSGAPIIGIAETVAEFKTTENVDTENVGVLPNTLAGFFKAGEADIIIAPINAGTKLYNAGQSQYQIAGVLTWGNTYFASANTTFELSDINGASITMFGENSITAATANYVLEQNSLAPSATEYLGSSKLTADKIRNDDTAIVMSAEPEISAVRVDKPNLKAYSINEEYKKITGFDIPQAAVFVDPDTVSNHKDLLDSFLSSLDETSELCTTNVEDVAEKAMALGYGDDKAVLAAGIPNCKVNYTTATSSKAAINKLIELFTSQFTKVPADTFYYN